MIQRQLIRQHFDRLIGKTYNPVAFKKEVDSFFSRLIAIENGDYIPEPITKEEYMKIVLHTDPKLLYGDISENINYINTGGEGVEDFLMFSELHRMTNVMKKLIL